MSLIPEAAPGIQNMSSKFASKLSARLASRAQDDLGGLNIPEVAGLFGQVVRPRDAVVPDSR